MRYSEHYTVDRSDREAIIKAIGLGKIAKQCRVDRGHRNGAEVHIITTTAIILVFNARTKKLITKLIARPNQIKRYYPEGTAPQFLLDLAYEHTKLHYNKI